MANITSYDEEIERITWFFAAQQQGMVTNEEFERIMHETFNNVEDPFTFTLTLLKWVQGLIVHGAATLDMRPIDYLDDFLKLLNDAQKED